VKRCISRELQRHRKQIVAAMNDMAKSMVKHAVAEKQIGPSLKWLEKRHPDWSNKQTIEHTGSVNLTAGLMTKAEIEALSDAELMPDFDARPSWTIRLPSGLSTTFTAPGFKSTGWCGIRHSSGWSRNLRRQARVITATS
jgi:hypothetical protein